MRTRTRSMCASALRSACSQTSMSASEPAMSSVNWLTWPANVGSHRTGARSPCLRELRAACALPVAVFGPRAHSRVRPSAPPWAKRMWCGSHGRRVHKRQGWDASKARCPLSRKRRDAPVGSSLVSMPRGSAAGSGSAGPSQSGGAPAVSTGLGVVLAPKPAAGLEPMGDAMELGGGLTTSNWASRCANAASTILASGSLSVFLAAICYEPMRQLLRLRRGLRVRPASHCTARLRAALEAAGQAGPAARTCRRARAWAALGRPGKRIPGTRAG
jgi:hypothetical protein